MRIMLVEDDVMAAPLNASSGVKSHQIQSPALKCTGRFLIVLCLVILTGCSVVRGSRNASNTDTRLAGERSCVLLEADAIKHIEQMKALAAKQTEARSAPRSILSVFKRATGRATSAQSLTKKYAKQKGMLAAVNAELEKKGCPRVELPPELATRAS